MMSSTARRCASSSRLAGPTHMAPASHDRCMRMWRPSSRFSNTVMCGKSSMFWKVRAIPNSATRSGRWPMMDRPFHRMSPSWGRYTWLMELKIDVLPAPLGPMMENSSPSATWNETSVMALTPLNDRLMESTSSRDSLMTTTASAACSASRRGRTSARPRRRAGPGRTPGCPRPSGAWRPRRP